jgi:hypothetical protein
VHCIDKEHRKKSPILSRVGGEFSDERKYPKTRLAGLLCKKVTSVTEESSAYSAANCLRSVEFSAFRLRFDEFSTGMGSPRSAFRTA